MIIREERGNGNRYFVAGYDAMGESQLSYKAIGILMYVLSKPDNWEANEDDLVKRHDDGRASVRAGIAELIDHGYMHRCRVVDERGRVIRWRLDTYESPALNPNFYPQSENRTVDNPECDFPQVENQIMDSPQFGFPQVDFPQVENQIMDSPQFGFPQVDFPQVENRTLTITNKELLLNKELKEGGGDSDPVEPQAPAASPSENILIVSETKTPETVGIDPQTLELSRRWSKNAKSPVRVRVSAQQAALVEAEPAPSETPSVKAADQLPPTVNPNRVISLPNGEQVIIQSSEWTGMVGAMLDGLGLRELADANVVWAKRRATDTLETAVKVSPMFRDRSGIEGLFTCWQRARPNTTSKPKAEWILEFSADLAGGRVKYPGGKNEESGRNRTGNSSAARDGDVPERTQAFDYWEWKKELAEGKYANEPF